MGVQTAVELGKEKLVNQKDVLVIGLGNAFRGDDAVGLFIADELKKQPSVSAKIIKHEGEPVELLDLWQVYDHVILLDASLSGTRVGSVKRYDVVKQRLPKTALDASSHAFSLATALDLAKTLNYLPKNLVLHTIEGSSFSMGQGLSPPVRQASETLIEELEEYLFFLKSC